MIRGKWEDHEDVAYVAIEEELHETDVAKLYLLESGEEQWVPKSLLQDEDDGGIVVPQWWAEKEGLEWL